MRRQGDFIREMVAMTESTGEEHIAQVIELDGKMGHTDTRTGSESAITREVAAKSMMDAFSVEKELKVGAGKVNVDDGKRHQIHTHPNGFAGLSATDIKSFAKGIYEDGQYPDSTLIATKSEGDIVLGGLYLTEEITQEDKNDLQRTVSLMASGKIALMDPANNDEEMLIDELMNVGAEFCAVVFPNRSNG